MDVLQSRSAAEPDSGRIDDRAPAPAREILAWLDSFAAAVRAVDYAAGRALFAPEVVAFGTVGAMLVGSEEVLKGQWMRVWAVTTGFRYDLDRARCGVAEEIGWAAAPWASQAVRDGRPFDRRGRASFVLRREGARWLAIHSHHSLEPVSADVP